MTPTPYHLADRGQSLGVRSEPEILVGLATGRLSSDVLSWQEGEVAWVPLRVRPEFASGLSAVASLTVESVLPWEQHAPTWQPRPRLEFIWPTIKAVLFRPRQTFTEAPASTSLRAPLQWMLWASLSGIVLGFPLWSLTLSLRPAVLSLFDMNEAAAPAIFNLTYFGRALLVYPIALFVLTVVATLLAHGLLRLMGGGKEGWQRTFRTLAYVAGALCFAAAIPPVAFTVPLWGLVLGALSLGYAHRDEAWRGFLALLALSCVGCCGGLIVAVLKVKANFMR